ncbi:MAG: hypothetical protein HOC74_31800 [Gemmatimonadetes bacterium]|jgi:hypothetical protein|nr:hypothetical protein [Gemmatimonadota bacterium]
MLRAAGRSLLICLALALVSGCADDTKYQFGLRGKWKLEQRVLPDGAVLTPPAISGLYEWYPMTKTRAHVTASVSLGQDQILVSTYTYDLNESGLTRNEMVRISGGYGTTPDQTYQTPGESTDGTVSGSGNQRVLTHANGMVQTYPDVTNAGVEDATFTVKFADGTVDTWRRIVDQLGALPK